MGYGSSPLHAASYYNHPLVVAELLKAGARSDIKNKFGMTAVEEYATDEIRELFFGMHLQTQDKQKTQYWNGYWTQNSKKGEMEISLVWDGSELRGNGKDEVGTFSLRGALLPDNSISFIKQYPSHQVLYKGQFYQTSMSGTWTIPDYDTGSFYLSRIS